MGAIAVTVIGVGAYGVFPQKSRTAEWHKKGYVAARDGHATINAVRRFFHSVFGSVRYQHVPDSDKMVIHRAALVKRGYVEAVVFSVSNVTSSQAAWAVHKANRAGPRLEHFGLEKYGEHGVRIWAATNDLVRWEQIVRSVDVASGSQ